MDTVIVFLWGFVLGAWLGVLILAIMLVAKKADADTEEEGRQ